MRHNREQLAHYLTETATLYDRHARAALNWLALDWSAGRAASLEARVSGTTDGDPVSAQAIAELDRLERDARDQARAEALGKPPAEPMHPKAVLARWTAAVEAIGLPVAATLRTDAGAHDLSEHRMNVLHQSARTLTNVLHLCRPIPRDIADKILENEARVTLDAGYCQACESPAGGDVRLHAGLCRPGCYDREKRQEQAGTYIDRATFCAAIKAGVARGEIVREASPLYRTAVPTVHEGEVA